MASLCKAAAAVCLVALYGLQSEAGSPTISYKYKPVIVGEAGYLAAKLVRNGKLSVHISEVAKDEGLVTTLTQTVNTTATEDEPAGTPGASGDKCGELVEKPKLKDIFHYAFENEQNLSEATPNYTKWLQAALDAGLKVFEQHGYQDNWGDIWGDDAGGSLAYLLGANSTKIGCVIGECIKVTTTSEGRSGQPVEDSTGKGALFCELSPAAEKEQAPFDEEYFDALIARKDKIADMTEADLKAPSNDDTAAAVVPAILAAGLVAVLTAISA